MWNLARECKRRSLVIVTLVAATTLFGVMPIDVALRNGGVATAEEEERPESSPKPGDAADKAKASETSMWLAEPKAVHATHAAWKAGDGETLKRMAVDGVDPWVIADELCSLGHTKAARALARAAKHARIEGLGQHLAGRPPHAPNDKLRSRLWTIERAIVNGSFADLSREVRNEAVPMDSIVGIRLAGALARIDAEMQPDEERARTLLRVGEAARAIGWLLCEAEFVHRAAEALDSAERYAPALPLFQRAIALHKRLGNGRFHSLGTVALARIQLRLSGHATALKTLDGVWSQLSSGADEGTAANAWVIRGACLEALGRYEDAERCYARSVRIAKDAEVWGVESSAWDQLGSLFLMQGRYAQALNIFDKQLRIASANDEPRGEAIAHQNMACTLSELGQFKASVRHYEKSLAIKESLGDRRGQVVTLIGLGGTLALHGAAQRARTALTRGLALAREIGAELSIANGEANLGMLSLDAKQYRRACAHFERAQIEYEARGDIERLASTNINMGNALEGMRRHDEAEASYREAQNRLEGVPSLSRSLGVAGALWCRARLAYYQRNYARATRLARQGIEIAVALTQGLSPAGGAKARDRFSHLFMIGLEAAIERVDVESMHWILEVGRSETLRRDHNRYATQTVVVPPVLRAGLDAARAKRREAQRRVEQALAENNRSKRREAIAQIRHAQREIEEIARSIERLYKAGSRRGFREPDSLASIRSLLARNEVYVTVGTVGQNSFALKVSPSHTRYVDLGSALPLVLRARFAMRLPSQPNEKHVARLARAVVDPLELEPHVTRVLLATSGAIGSVPPSMLFPHRDVVLVSSGTSLATARRRVRTETQTYRGVLALGDPHYDADSATSKRSGRGWGALQQLPHTRAEVEAIGTTKLLGEHATPQGFRSHLKTSWRSIHFACHGRHDPVRPMLSALALTPTGEDDGYLAGHEISLLHVSSELVVLSACETARGTSYETSGTLGLAQAFRLAGAKRVLCSLWKVDDEASKELMIRFYEAWKGKTTAAAALRSAQAHVRKQAKWKDPYYWAAWVLWGLP